jgi:hypothetical protein
MHLVMCIIWSFYLVFSISAGTQIAEGGVIPVRVVEREIMVTTRVVEMEVGVGTKSTEAVVGAGTETGSRLTAVSVAAAGTGRGQDTMTEVGARKGDGKEMRSSQVGVG